MNRNGKGNEVDGNKIRRWNRQNRAADTYAKVLAHERVDDGIDKTVRHWQPVACEVEADEGVISNLTLVSEDLRMKEDDQHEDLDRQPADSEQQHDQRQHLDHLNKPEKEEKKGKKSETLSDCQGENSVSFRFYHDIAEVLEISWQKRASTKALVGVK